MLASDAKKAFRMETPSIKPEPEKLVIVTGFGPFEGHEDVNASWEAVKLLPDKLELNEQNYKLEKQQVSVEYEAVNKAVEEIWQRKPELVIHCGVHGKANCIHVERLAFNHKFKRPDYKGKFLQNGSACLENCGDGKQHSSDDVLHTALNVDSIIAKISKTYTCTMDDINTGDTFEKTDATIAKCSSDVGDYLCGYIYLKSLDINNERSLFVHVPPIDKPFSSEDTADVILNITKECLRQLQESIKV